MANHINPKKEAVVFQGRRYSRNPGDRYFSCQRWDPERKRYFYDSIHRAVWREAHGEIPRGSHVHHKNGDWNDNRLENLEVLSHGDHMRAHSDTFSKSPKLRRHLDRIRTKALQAHTRYKRTARGKQESRQRGLTSQSRAPVWVECCVQCGTKFERQSITKPRHCSQRCKWNWAYAHGGAERRKKQRAGL